MPSNEPPDRTNGSERTLEDEDDCNCTSTRDRTQIEIQELEDGMYRAWAGKMWFDGSTPAQALHWLTIGANGMINRTVDPAVADDETEYDFEYVVFSPKRSKQHEEIRAATIYATVAILSIGILAYFPSGLPSVLSPIAAILVAAGIGWLAGGFRFKRRRKTGDNDG